MNNLLRQMGVWGGVAMIAATGCAMAENTALYTTSFEKMPVGSLTEQTEGKVVWKGIGNVEITDKYQNKGSQSLHLLGGTHNTVELALGSELQDIRGIRFQAERWTSADPFEFRILACVDGKWEETAELDDLVRTGKFSSKVVAKLPEGKITFIRLTCTAPEAKGALIDDLALLKDEPKNVTKAPEVAKEPIAKLVYDELLFKNGATYTETITMVDRAKSFKNYAGATIKPNDAKENKERTKVYRIPAIITAKNGDLIATCDARRDHGADLNRAEDIDIAIRRSSDNGKTWSDMEILCEFGEGHPASDPSLVLDKVTGEIFCFYNYMDRNMSRKARKNEYRLWVQSSKDHGKTWSEPRDITDDITPPEWKWNFKFMTSGRGCQTRDGVLLHNVVRVGHGLHLFGSKDHGKNWHLVNTEPMSPADESKVIELADGSLMVNSRVNRYGTRHVHVSKDGGQTWTGWREDQLVDPGCNGAIIRYTSKEDGYQKNRLIFSNANSFNGRKNLAVRISYDEGKTWSKGKVITSGTAMYSDLTICPDGSIGILYEPGNGVRFTSITLEDLTDGKDKLSKPYRLPGVNK